VHGFGASTDHWRHNLPVLSVRHEVHAIDLLGFGRSAKPQGLPYGGALWRDQLAAYVRERIGRPTVLVGNSLGGYAALAAGAALSPAAAHEEPGLAAGVVLLNAAGPFSGEQADPKGWGAIARRTVGRAILTSPVVQRLLFENLRRPATVRRTLERVYIDRTNVDDALVDSILRPARDPGAFGVFQTVFDIPRGEPLDALFAGLGAPLLLLWGLRDPWINAEGRRATFALHAPPRTTEVLLDAGHCPHDEVPQQVNAALLNWLHTLTPATASLP
jgi:pimeloyl-ACP methyl ester carboxylesterase